jgi:hypothetical protein
LIDESSSPSCNEIFVENVVEETSYDLIVQENEELKKEVTRLTKDLTRLKKKRKVVMSARNNLLEITVPRW